MPGRRNGRRADANDAVVGHTIRALRLARKMSQAALADRIGVTSGQVQKYEKGRNCVGASRLVRVATALDVPVLRLLDGVAGSPRNSNMPPAIALIAHAHPLRLVKAFAMIDDRGVRGALMMLTEGIARMAQHARTRAAALPSRPRHRA
jgi:transcriptional regulator with XRE-family HTH domain